MIVSAKRNDEAMKMFVLQAPDKIMNGLITWFYLKDIVECSFNWNWMCIPDAFGENNYNTWKPPPSSIHYWIKLIRLLKQLNSFTLTIIKAS